MSKKRPTKKKPSRPKHRLRAVILQDASFSKFVHAPRGAVGYIYDKEDTTKVAYLATKCPRCGAEACLPVNRPSTPGQAAWDFNGDLKRPTLSPSVFHTKPHGCGWHGFLRRGTWVHV